MDQASRRPASSVDVAAHAGVSQATVSRVLSGKGPVSASTRARVEKSLEELGYQPNLNARALKTNRTRTIAVVVADITNPFYPELVEALSQELMDHGQMMVLWNDANAGDDGAVVASMQQGLVDGAIFATATEQSPTLSKARALGLPVVLVNRRVDEMSFDSVTSDNARGGALVASYFAEHGRSAAVIAGPKRASTSANRAQGFIEQWSADHDGETPIVEFNDFSYDSGAAFCRKVLALPKPPDAIFATNDLTALGVLDEARRLGVRVPEDLWIVGYDDIAMAGWDVFSLTTVRQPTAEMAALAVQALLERVQDPERPVESVRFACELIVRSTTAGQPRTCTP